MGGKSIKSTFNRIVADIVTKKHIYGAIFNVSTEDKRIDLISAAGNIQEDSQYYIASINKIFISAITLRMYRDGQLDLQDKISKYLPGNVVSRLHVYRGKDYSNELTILHLISQTSGLPGYLIDKQADGTKAMKELEAGIDQAWPIEKAIVEVKKMNTHFPPGKPGKAKYIDTNHQILSLAIENITGKPINSVLRDLFEEIKLTRTYACSDVNDKNFVPIRYKSETINIPLFLTSTRNDIISTATDQMTFLKAFFNGQFFPMERFGELYKWNNVFFPFKYGVGIQKFYVPRIFSPFKRVPHMIGHSGSVGSVAFYVPDIAVYITGTVNQQARPNVAFQTMIKILNTLFS
ncbi:MAG: beta-lactamase family protein [candidate division WOR-3 bacterium]|nr:MAG: beta-lactamase family protein [candidate division WOR-3 bacterium]